MVSHLQAEKEAHFQFCDHDDISSKGRPSSLGWRVSQSADNTLCSGQELHYVLSRRAEDRITPVASRHDEQCEHGVEKGVEVEEGFAVERAHNWSFWTRFD